MTEKIARATKTTRRGATYHISPMSHEDGEVGQVTAGASGVALVGFQQFAALSGPVSHHAPLRVIPEGAVGIVVVLLLQKHKRREEKKQTDQTYMNMCCNMHDCAQTHLVYFICLTVRNRTSVYLTRRHARAPFNN